MTHCSITGGKILSCCYCGVQSTFLPAGDQQGRGGTSRTSARYSVQGGVQGSVQVSMLVCGTCGAPLSVQKARPLSPGKGAALPRPSAKNAGPGKAKGKSKKRKSSYKESHAGPNGFETKSKPGKTKPRKKRKSLFRKLVSEAVDLVEDIFD